MSHTRENHTQARAVQSKNPSIQRLSIPAIIREITIVGCTKIASYSSSNHHLLTSNLCIGANCRFTSSGLSVPHQKNAAASKMPPAHEAVASMVAGTTIDDAFAGKCAVCSFGHVHLVQAPCASASVPCGRACSKRAASDSPPRQACAVSCSMIV